MQAHKDEFFISDHSVFQDEYSAFDTYDFQRRQRPFNKRGYAIKKIYERVNDLAILHSSVSSAAGRKEILDRFRNLVNRNFRDRLLASTDQYRREQSAYRRNMIKRKIGRLNSHIMECNVIWGQYAPPENWDC